ncbi:MAG TPA: MEDS domain-containing protein [Ramlibacter sp.]|nr:MEDS domain-containing protein [Ramlibacter sp.]
MRPTANTMPLAGAHLCQARHVCAFFHSDDEQYQVTLPYIRDGLAAGHKAVHIVNPDVRGDHLRRIEAFGMDAAQAQRDGQLELHDWSDTFFAEGDFSADRMLGQLAAVLQAGRGQGYPLTRFVAHAEWGLDPRASLDELLEFEARVNTVWPEGADSVVCCYDLNRFQGDVVIEALRTHPMVIIGGILQENPFFVPADRFLQERRSR